MNNYKFIFTLFSFAIFNSSILYAQETEQEVIIDTVDQKLLEMIGKPAPNFILPDLDWNEINLSEVEGKVILLDFWASWCRYCRVLNRDNAAIYEIYKDKGFEIVSISFDSDYYKWKKASQIDNITWINVNDKNGMDSEVGRLFNINHTPTTFLLDKNRTIIAVEIEGDELEEKLQELLK